ncbi:MAG: hypothetical protein EOO38_06275 [Cytophagaceae bacterium]|nr:MAG: hypothetical protein EOO38_06275 [Cytophagaceae bacterium]
MEKHRRDVIAAQATDDEKEKFWARVVKGAECWLFTPIGTGGYGRARVQRTPVQAHRAALIWAVGYECADKIACHLCTNKNCVRPDHLYWGTHLSNAHDRKRDGTNNNVPRGETHLRAQLSEKQVIYIWNKIAGGNVPAIEMARQFNVSVSAIEKIIARKNWVQLTKRLQPMTVTREQRGSNRGTNHPKAKLDDDKVRVIRNLSATGLSASKIAAQMHVSKEAIAMVLQGRTWKHVI